MYNNRRDVLKSLVGGTFGSGFLTQIATADEDSSQQEEIIAVEVAENEDRQLVAFSAVDDDVLCLFLAKGMQSTDGVAEELVQITEPSGGSVLDLEWESSDELRYWQDSPIHSINIGSRNMVSSQSTVGSQLVPEGLTIPDSSQTESRDSVETTDETTPGGGGGGVPDWMYNGEYHRPAIEQCRDASITNICISTYSISPKFLQCAMVTKSH